MERSSSSVHLSTMCVVRKNKAMKSQKILNITLDIIHLLTGEEYIVVNKSGSRSPCVSDGSPPVLEMHARMNHKMILELTSKIMELLADEEWTLSEDKRDQHQRRTARDQTPLNSHESSVNEESAEKCHSFVSPDDLCEEDSPIFHSNDDSKSWRISEKRKPQTKSVHNARGKVYARKVGDTIDDVPTDHLQLAYMSSPIKKEMVSSDEGGRRDTVISLSKRCVQSEYIPVLSNGESGVREDRVLPDMNATADCTSVYIKEESDSCEEDITETSFSTANDHTEVECTSDFAPDNIITFTLGENYNMLNCESHNQTLGNAQNSFEPRHLNSPKVNKLSCTECEKSFTHKADLILHQRYHTGENLFVCPECGKCFTRHSLLIIHLRIHTGEKPFSCIICGKRFSENSGLVKHKRVHTGERPFSCSYCGKTFTNSSNLIKHQRLHTGERPFVCTTCGQRFHQKPQLVSHGRIHLVKQ